jgi:magnesium chelatase family protein
VLFRDELSEFTRPALEALRQPLEDGHVLVVRGQRASRFPTRFMLVAATNPCPCGFSGEPRCRCTDADFARHRRRLSGPLLDRMDLLIGVPRPTADDLSAPAATTTAVARERVLAARERQTARLEGSGVTCNAQLTVRLLRRHVALSSDGEAALRDAHRTAQLSARGRQRVLRVARTIADLAGAEAITTSHLAEAIQYRSLDRRARALQGDISH